MNYCTPLFLYRSWAPCFARFACRPKLDLRPAAAPACVVFCGLRLRRAASPRRGGGWQRGGPVGARRLGGPARHLSTG